MAIRTNYCTNPTFETDLNGWVSDGAAWGRYARGYAGTIGVASTVSTATKLVSATAVPSAAGDVWSVGAYVQMVSSSGNNLSVGLRFVDGAGATISEVLDTTFLSQNTSLWVRRGPANLIAPANTAGVKIVLSGLSGTYFDAVMLEKAASVGGYFDGSTVAAGKTYGWIGAPNASASTEALPGDIYVKHLYFAEDLTVANPTITVADTPAAGDVMLLLVGANAVAASLTAVSGMGATWTRVPGALSNSAVLDAWIGVGATSSGTITTTGAVAPRALAALMVSGTTATTVANSANASGTSTSAYQTAGPGQVIIGFSFADSAANAVTAVEPADSWTENDLAISTSASRFMGVLTRVPSASAAHRFSAFRSGGSSYVSQIMLGDVPAAGKTITSALAGAGTLSSTTTQPTKKISSALSGTGTLGASLAYTKRLNSALSGSGTLTAKLQQRIVSGLSGSGSLTSVLAGRLIKSNFSGSGSLTSALRRNIASAMSGSGTLESSLAYVRRIDSLLSGDGSLTSSLDVLPTKQISSALGAEGALFSELGYVVKPDELGSGPLGKLSSFAVSTSAVPANPAEGSGSVPSINASYTNGVDPEYALGETNLLKNGAIGTYEGEVVKVGTSQNSGLTSISMDTLLTPLNVDLRLFPFIDGVPGLWTAARAVDYWSQQAGLFYDKVEGDCLVYASGFGHGDAFGAGATARFYERLSGGTTTTQVVNGRSVKTLGSAATGTTAFHEAKDEAVRVTLPKNRKLVFSAGLGLSGSGRMATVEWNFLDAKGVPLRVSLDATSDGGVSASIGTDVVASASVPAGASYRLSFSLERLSTTAVVGKLTVRTDDLAGSGDLAFTGDSTIINKSLPGILRLVSMAHRSAGGSGAEMTRWGTYLAVSDRHPMGLPAVQKTLGQSKKEFGFVSGFTGNVWNLLNEFCSIARLEVRFIDGALNLAPRSNVLANPGSSWARFDVDRARRDKYKQVAVVNKQSQAVSTDDAVLWRADSVYQVAAREVFETTVQTGHSILNVVQPVPVDGITPFPYRKGGGQYVVTGADGYIVSPQWWIDYGGKIEVSLTGVEGEIAIKITAPAQDTVRAPYRISEGEADRPALYICGSGILNDPKEVHVSTGAKNAREGFDNVFESPFIAGIRETYDTAVAMAHQYSASVAEVSYELPNSFDTPTGLGQFPAGALVTDNLRNYRIQDASQTHSKVSGNAVAHTTIGAYVASYPDGATIRDEKARNAGRSIRKFNIKPLKGDS